MYIVTASRPTIWSEILDEVVQRTRPDHVLNSTLSGPLQYGTITTSATLGRVPVPASILGRGDYAEVHSSSGEIFLQTRYFVAVKLNNVH
jgi:hypothetical protein